MQSDIQNILKAKYLAHQKDIKIKEYLTKRTPEYIAALKIQRWFRSVYLHPVNILPGIYCLRLCLDKYNLIHTEEYEQNTKLVNILTDDELVQYNSYLQERNELIEQINLIKIMSLEHVSDFKIYHAIDIRDKTPTEIVINDVTYYLNKQQVNYIEKSKRRVNHNLIRVLELSKVI